MMIKEYLERFLYHIEQPCDIPIINKRIKFKNLYVIILLIFMFVFIGFSIKRSLDTSRQEKIEKEFAIAEELSKEEERKDNEIEEVEETNLDDYENRDKIEDDNTNTVDLSLLTEEERKKRSEDIEDVDLIKNKNNEIKDEEIKSNQNQYQEELKKRYAEQSRTIEANNNYDSNRIIPNGYVYSNNNDAEYKENIEFKNRLDTLEKEVNSLGVNSDIGTIQTKQKELENLTEEIKKQKEIIEKLGQAIEGSRSNEQNYKMLVLNNKKIMLLNDKESYLVTKTDDDMDLMTYIKLLSDFLDDKVKEQTKFSIEKIDESDFNNIINKLEKAGVELW